MASSSPSAPAQSKASHRGGPQPKPPDERFWVRYSPHHELPISVAGSFLIHGVGFLLIALVLVGALKGLLGDTKPPEVSPLAIIPGGGGGNPKGIGDAPGSGVLPAGKEAPPPDVKGPLVSVPRTDKTPDLRKVDQTPPPLVDPSVEGPSERLVQASQAALGQLTDVGKEARRKLDGIIAGHGKGGPGSGGGEGAGRGTGKGDLEGPGGLENQRTRRRDRWVMIFNTADGKDYLSQLQHLEAYIAVPHPAGGYVVYRDLNRRPLQGQLEDVSQINRIFWIDDKPHSVHALAQAMGIFPPPQHIAAFFPEKLELELRRKEETALKADRYHGPEENIEETRFNVIRRGNKYEPIVAQRPKLRGK